MGSLEFVIIDVVCTYVCMYLRQIIADESHPHLMSYMHFLGVNTVEIRLFSEHQRQRDVIISLVYANF